MIIECGRSKAWPVEFVTGPQRGSVCSWIVDAPWAHPAWSQYLITACHLRDVEGLPRPIKFDDRATHEVIVAALDPRILLTPENSSRVETHLGAVVPLNFVGQWRAKSDEEAAGNIKGVVNQIVRGNLSPDTDFRQMWAAMFPYLPPEQTNTTRH